MIRNNEEGVDSLLRKAEYLAGGIESEFAAQGWELAVPEHELQLIFLQEIVENTGSETKIHLVMDLKKKRWTAYGVTVVLRRKSRR